MLRDDIMQLMIDGTVRTSYQIADALFGDHATPRQWFKVSGVCDRLVEQHRLLNAGKNAQHQTMYIG